jgi:hypothetical protein
MMLAHPGETWTIKTIEQHFHWQTLSYDTQQFVQMCQTCQHYKWQCKNYGHLPIKIQCDLKPTMEWTSCRLDWTMDDSAMPFQKAQPLHNVWHKTTSSSPCINYDWSKH